MCKIKLGLSAAATLLCIGAAHAQAPVQFASFSQAAGGTPFFLASDGANSTLALASAIPVNFQFQVGNSYGSGIGDNIAATLSLFSQIDGTPVTLGSLVAQPIKNIEIVFTADTPVLGSTNLLSLTGSTGLFSGVVSGSTGALTGTQSELVFDSVNYSSDFLDFTGPFVNKNFAISFANVDPGLSVGIDGYLNSFSASASGTFGSSPTPNTPPPTNNLPEPATLSLLGLGLASYLFTKRKKIIYL